MSETPEKPFKPDRGDTTSPASGAPAPGAPGPTPASGPSPTPTGTPATPGTPTGAPGTQSGTPGTPGSPPATPGTPPGVATPAGSGGNAAPDTPYTPPRPKRTSAEIRVDIDAQRAELGQSVDQLRDRVTELTDWRSQLKKHRKQIIVGAVATGFVVGGLMALRRR